MTNWDMVKKFTAEEFSEAFWKILDMTKWYTDSRLGLKEWLVESANNPSIYINPKTSFESYLYKQIKRN